MENLIASDFQLVITKNNTFCRTALMLSFFVHCDSDGHSFLSVEGFFSRFRQISLIHFHLSHSNCYDILQYKVNNKLFIMHSS